MAINASYPRITGTTFLFDLILAPLTLLYAMSVVKSPRLSNKLISAHLALPILVNVVYFPYHILADWNSHLINNENLSGLMTVAVASKISYQVVYQLSAIIVLIKFLGKVDDSTDLSQVAAARWLRNILLAVMVLLPIVMLFEVIPGVDGDLVTVVIMLISIYSIGYAALRNPHVYPRLVDATTGQIIDVGPKYQTSALSDGEKEQYADQIRQYMEAERPHLNANLSFDDLAGGIGIQGHNLSQVINEVLNQNFYDFVNSYRVDAVVERIKKGDHLRVNLLTIGLECGFNSKATFNRAFKKATEKTPQQFIKDL